MATRQGPCDRDATVRVCAVEERGDGTTGVAVAFVTVGRSVAAVASPVEGAKEGPVDGTLVGEGVRGPALQSR